MKTNTSPTYDFLRLIGSPYNSSNTQLKDCGYGASYDYAIKNRVRLLYLNSLVKCQKLGSLQDERDILLEKYKKIQEAFIRISNVLEEAKINYAFFKSIRPYQEVTADIDILIFGNQYERVLKVMNNTGYFFLGRGPLSTTFLDVDAEIGLDIYEDVGVSHIIYMDKSKLSGFSFEVNISSSCIGRSLYPEADLLAVIAHSIIKEHMYVLSEYYTTLYYLKNGNDAMLLSFVSLAEKCNLLLSAQVHLSITGFLHSSVHGFIPERISRLLKMLNVKSGFEQSRVAKSGLRMPHKYHPTTIARAFAEKLGEEKARESFAAQMASMLNPEFALSFSKTALKHVFRETY